MMVNIQIMGPKIALLGLSVKRVSWFSVVSMHTPGNIEEDGTSVAEIVAAELLPPPLRAFLRRQAIAREHKLRRSGCAGLRSQISLRNPLQRRRRLQIPPRIGNQRRPLNRKSSLLFLAHELPADGKSARSPAGADLRRDVDSSGEIPVRPLPLPSFKSSGEAR